MRHTSAHSIAQGLWVIQLALLGLLAMVLVAKQAWRSFPFFTWYSLFNLVAGLVEFFLNREASPYVYAYAYIAIETVSIVLGLTVVYEIFTQLFVSQGALRRLATYLLGGAVLLLVGLGTSVVYLHAPSLKNTLSAILISEEAARTLEVGLLVFLFVCSSAFGLQWRQPIFGIALGLGFFTTVQLILMTVWTYIISSANVSWIGITGLVAFNVSLVLWIGYLLAPERVTATSQLPDRSQLEQWNRAVMELIHQ